MQIIRTRTILFLLFTIILASSQGAVAASIAEQAPHARQANCGALALAHVMALEGDRPAAGRVAALVPRTGRGFSLARLEQIAHDQGHHFAAVRMQAWNIDTAPRPFIVHLASEVASEDGHYIVLEAADHRTVTLFDAQADTRYQLARCYFLSRWQGYALVKGFTLPAGARIVDQVSAHRIHGGYDTQASTPGGSGDYGGGGPGGGGFGGGGGGNPCGSPAWDVNMVNMNLIIKDIPLWYTPPIGPQVHFALTYNSKYPTTGPQPVGRKWVLNYSSYLQENSVDGSARVVLPDGKQNQYAVGSMTIAGIYVSEYKAPGPLEKLGANHFRLTMPDGTVYIYQIPAGSNAPHPLLVEWRDPAGQAVKLGYNSSAQLVTVTDAVQRVSNIFYENERIDHISDPFGRSATFEYDDNGDLRKITDMGGYWTAMAYDPEGYISEIENEKGKTLFYIEPSDTGSTKDAYPPPGATMQANYRITVTNPEGKKSEYYYNGRSGYGWYVSPRHYMEYEDENNNNFASGNVPKIIYYYANTAKGVREEIGTIIYQEGTQVGYGYNYDTGLLESISDFSNNTYSFTRNDLGLVTSIQPPVGLPVTYQYNPDNNIDLEHVVRESQAVIRYQIPENFQRDFSDISIDGVVPNTSTNANTAENNDVRQIVWNISYNDRHQITGIEDEVAHFYGPIVYDSFGRIDTITETFDGRSVITDYDYYDPGVQGQYRLKEIRKDGQVVAAYTYDLIGRVRTATDATGLTLTYDYNALNHVTRITYPDTKFVEYSYSSCCPRLVDAVTDRDGRTTSYYYDQMQRLETVHKPGVGYIRFHYDANGNLEQLIDANGQETRFEYDNEDRLYRKYDAKERFVEYHYNRNGLLEQRINTRGVTATYDYYEDHQLAGITYSDGTPGVSIIYDRFRRPDMITDALGRHDLIYYDNDLLKGVSGPWADTIIYKYDNLNRLHTVTPQGGRQRTFNYDNQGRLAEMLLDTAIYKYGYQGVKPMVDTLTRPNRSVSDYDYNGLNQLEHLTHRNAAGAILSKFDYQYNDQDRVDHETITGALDMSGMVPGVTTYDYNALNQLTAQTNPDRLFSYDDDGNMTSGYTPDGYAFNAEYDAEDRLSAIWYTVGDTVRRQEFVYRYDGFLGRIITYENAVLIADVRVVRDGNLAIQERNADNTVTREYAWGPNLGGGIGGLLNLRQDGRDYDYLYDGKGNVSALIDNAQSIVASYRYDAFGRLKVKTGTLDQPFQFSTKRYLGDLGLSYYGYRFYSPAIGRWMNRDPLGEAGGINLYGFVQNDPVNKIDPYGEFAIAVPAIVVYGVFAVATAYYGTKAINETQKYLEARKWDRNDRYFYEKNKQEFNKYNDKKPEEPDPKTPPPNINPKPEQQFKREPWLARIWRILTSQYNEPCP